MPTHSEENYIKAIWKLSQGENPVVTTNSIAASVNTKAASVSDMLRKLSEKKLIRYEKYQGVELTASGRKTALSIVRKHRLWEVFLVEKLNYGWDEVHEIAEQLEHIVSDNLVDRLDLFLGHPKVDPHGDPIPDKNGRISDPNGVLLSSIAAGQTVTMTGVTEHSTAFLRYLDNHSIGLGCKMQIEEINSFDFSMNVRIKGRKAITITQAAAKNILVKPERSR
ncbi:MAG: metal-dependent transcriptional regulator [Bacteroidia bacterium]|nr:metal-dependent transcriptional regulator [Bacteroidia bacterium]